MKILIVDDDRMICDGTAHRIVNMHLEDIESVNCAYSAEEALEMLQQQHFDAIFTDICMDGMDGLEMIEAIKSIQPNILFVVITAFDRFQYAQQAIRLGVEDFAVKPLSLESMKKHVLKVIDKYKGMSAQKETRLDLEICAQLSRSDRDVHACFTLCSATPPPADVYMVVWDTHDRLNDMSALQGRWLWRSQSQPLLLIDATAESVITQLKRLAKANGIFIGVSAPGRNVKTLSTQASCALGFSWMHVAEEALLWSPQNVKGISSVRSKMLAEMRSMNAEGLKTQLDNFFSGMTQERRSMACTLMEALSAELYEIELNLGMEADPSFSPKAGMGIVRTVDKITRRVEAVKQATKNPDRLNPVAYAMHYAKEHLYESIDMAVLANHLNLSYAYFSRIFHEQAGMTFSKYLLELRMQEVCRLLKQGEKLVNIAERFGYQNAANLTRSFTREIGMSPSKWLEIHGEKK